VSETERIGHPQCAQVRAARSSRATAIGCLLVGVVLLGATLSGCGGSASPTGASEPTATVGAHMAGPVVDVKITQAALDSKPKPWVLTTPESAVRSYLDWTSYAYRIAQSDVATPTMSAAEEVRVDSYVQLNIEQSRVIDQVLGSITFGKQSHEGTKTLVPATEKWTYRYVSIETAGKVLEGPYSASYETTYTVVKSPAGWVVDSVEAKASDEVK
jgi:hypothetical protein